MSLYVITCLLLLAVLLVLALFALLLLDVIITARRDADARRNGRRVPQDTWLEGGRWPR